ncbi:coiled-coil domain-containing protein 30 isoform X2 [Xenopus tropicalis]|uniref:Coiled-coil domain-containing protein 30 isoform X2 n=1 Tax=Xenopus tropicalis TaxID=8364 RepID=A0A8J1JWL5_XENTR|nr:coiled-coil domain-containing protein 30 isoform X2 [Xenopus tropicalis]
MDEAHWDLEDIFGKLKDEGLQSAASADERLIFLWNLYQGIQTKLHTTRNELEELRQQQAEEMKEVESYVAHIRSLTEEREALTTDFEKENIQLRAELAEMHNQQESQLKEVEEMLDQEGLNDIANSSPSEQVAYLLVERATLLEKLDMLENQMDSHLESLSSINRQEELEQIHKTLEEELYQQRETMKRTKETLSKAQLFPVKNPWKKLFGIHKNADKLSADRSTFEEEVAKEKKKKEGLERDLEEASHRLQMAHDEIRKLTEELLIKKKEITELDLLELQKAKQHNSRLDKEILALRSRIKLLDSERKKSSEESEISKSESAEKSQHNQEKTPQDNTFLHKRYQLEIEEKECQNKALLHKLQKLQSKYDETVERNEELESILGETQNQTKEQISYLECEVEGLQRTIMNLEAQLTKLREKSDATGKDQVMEHHIKKGVDLQQSSSLTNECKWLKEKQTSMSAMLLEKEQICHQLEEKIESLENEMYAMSIALAESKKKSEILQKKINEGMGENQKLWEENIHLRQDVNTTRQELQTKREENARIKQEILNMQEKVPRPQICADGAEEIVPNLLAGDTLIQQQHEEIRQLRQDLHRAQHLCSSAEKELRYERDKNLDIKKQHFCLEQANTMVSAELNQLKQKFANVTATCLKLENELEMKQQRIKEMELEVLKQTQISKVQNNWQEKLEHEKSQAHEAEKKILELQQQLRASQHQLQLVQSQVAERKHLEEEMKNVRENETALRTKLQEEQLKRKVLEQSCQDLKHQMGILFDKETVLTRNNSALQHKIHQQESQLLNLDDVQTVSAKERIQIENTNQKLTEELLHVQQEKQQLHKEYENILKQLDEYIRKYHEKELRHKAKLSHAKEIHINEVNQMDLYIKQLGMEIKFLKSQAEKDQQWISKITTENEHLNEEKRILLQKMNEHEAMERNHKWDLLSAQNRAHILDEENRELQEGLLQLYNQVSSLDRVLKKIKALNIEEITNMIPSELHILHLPKGSFSANGIPSPSGILKAIGSTEMQNPVDYKESLSFSITPTSDIGYLNVSSPGVAATSPEPTPNEGTFSETVQTFP